MGANKERDESSFCLYTHCFHTVVAIPTDFHQSTRSAHLIFIVIYIIFHFEDEWRETLINRHFMREKKSRKIEIERFY